MNLNKAQAQALLARFDRLPTWPFPWWVSFLLGLSFFFAFYDVVVIGFALPQLMKQFQISQSYADWSITSGLIGYIVGSFIIARISDYYGRKLSVIISVGCYAIGTLLMATSTSMNWLIAWRFISGLGLGAEIACCVSYFSELAPANYRGKATAIGVGFGYFGFALTPFIALAILPHLTWGWRILFMIGGICGVISFFFRRKLPQSPRWLILHGQFDEAKTIIEQAEKNIKAKGLKLLPEREVNIRKIPEDISLTDMLRSNYVKYLGVFIVIWFFYYIGNYAFLTLQNSLLTHIHFDLANSVLLISLQSIGFIVGSIIAYFITDRFERKWTCLITAVIWAIALFFIGWLQIKYIIVIAGFIAATTIAVIVPMMYTFTAENFPTRFRSTGTSLTDGIGHLGGAFCGQIVFFFYHLFNNAHLGVRAAYWTMAISSILTAVALLFAKPQTKMVLKN